MEKPPCLHDFQEQHSELNEQQAFEEWSLALTAFQKALSETVRAPDSRFNPKDV